MFLKKFKKKIISIVPIVFRVLCGLFYLKVKPFWKFEIMKLLVKDCPLGICCFLILQNSYILSWKKYVDADYRLWT